MIRNYLVVAYRSLVRHKVFSCINLAGLALGIASSLLLLQYAGFELSYDDFHRESKNIYRIRLDSYKGGVFEGGSAIGYHGAAPAIKASFPQVVDYVRLHRADGMLNYYPPAGPVVSHYELKGLYADSSFFSVFSFPLVKGNRKTVLRNAASMALSESAARKYFGTQDPLGKVLRLSTEWEGGDYVVEGVFKDVPENSHVRFDFLFAIENLLNNRQFKTGGWYWTNFYTYLQLRPGADVHALEAGLATVVDAHLGNVLRSSNRREKFLLQPLTDIHLHSDLTSEIDLNGDSQTVFFILLIAFLIMGIAWLNYVNLSTARAMERAREVGVRKVFGAGQRQLVRQFLLESGLLIAAALLLAAVLLLGAKPLFARLTGKEVAFDLAGQGVFWAVVAGMLVTGTWLSAFYPAFVLSAFKPIATLKGKLAGNPRGSSLRKGMVVGQFVATIVLIVATLTVSRQIDFMRGQNLGLNIDRKLVVRAPRVIRSESFSNEVEAFKTALLKHAAVTAVTASSEVPGREIFWTKEFSRTREVEKDKKIANVLSVDDHFIPAYGITLLAGRNFSAGRVADYGGSVILNERALRLFGFEDAAQAVGQTIYDLSFMPKKIIGVVADFHQQSLQNATMPLVLVYTSWQNGYLTVSFNHTSGVQDNIRLVTSVYKQIFPENAVEYFFLDDYFNRQYQAEERFGRIFTLFSALAIFISCTGLLGLSAFIISQRTREVGIRKVLGGSVAGIVVLLSKDFLRLVAVAFVPAVPAAWWLMGEWLRGFAYRTDIPFWIFMLAGSLVFLIAFLTVIVQAVKAATANPVKSLQAE